MDAGHVLLFGALAFSLEQRVLSFRMSSLIRRVGSLLLIAVAVECIQPIFERSASFTDAVNGWAGVLLGASGFWIFKRNPFLARKVLWLLFASLALCFALYPAWLEWQVVKWRQQSLPLLSNFETNQQRKLWIAAKEGKADGTKLWLDDSVSHSGQYALCASNPPDRTIGVTYDAGYSDWSAYQKLSIWLFVQSDGIVNIRIDDDGDCTEFDSRFNRATTLQKGWNRIELANSEIAEGPVSRVMNLGNVRRVMFFTTENRSQTICFDDFALE